MKYLVLLLALAFSSLHAADLPKSITADGTYTHPTYIGKRYVVSVSGTFGGGSLAINWTNGITSTAYTGSPATAAKSFTFTAAANTAEFILTGSTTPAIAVSLALADIGSGGGTVDVSDITGLGTAATADTADLLLAPVAVADATARKLAGTYVTAEVTPVNGLRVIQTDLPDVVWTLLDVSDITLDANWFGAPRTDSEGALALSNVVLSNRVLDGTVFAQASAVNAGNVILELGRYALTAEEIADAIDGWYLLSGTIFVSSVGDTTFSGSNLTVGVHPLSSSITSLGRGVYATPVAGAAGLFVTKYEVFIPIKLTSQTSGTQFKIEADATKSPTHAWRYDFNAGSLTAQTAMTFTTGGISTNYGSASGDSLVVSLRIGQDATFTGTFILSAINLQLKRIS